MPHQPKRKPNLEKRNELPSGPAGRRRLVQNLRHLPAEPADMSSSSRFANAVMSERIYRVYPTGEIVVMSRPVRESVMGRVVNKQRHMQADDGQPVEPGQPCESDHATTSPDSVTNGSRATYPDRHGRFKCPLTRRACGNSICPAECRWAGDQAKNRRDGSSTIARVVCQTGLNTA